MSNDLLGDENEVKLDPEVAASAFPDIEGVDDKYPELPTTDNINSDIKPTSTDLHTNVNENVDEIHQFESSFPALEGEEQLNESNDIPQPSAPSFITSEPLSKTSSQGGLGSGAGGVSAPLFSARSNTEPEPEPVRQWREKRSKEIEERDEQSEKSKDEIKLKAERAIDNFYKEYNERKEKNIAKNKQDEVDYLNNRTDKLASGTTWQRINDLLELKNVSNKQLNRKDLNRFKEIIINLSEKGEKA